MKDNVLAFLSKMYPLQSEQAMSEILDLVTDDLELTRAVFTKGLQELLRRVETNSEVYASEIYHLVIGVGLLRIPMADKEKESFLRCLSKMINPEGGFFPTVIGKEWQRRSRIYSTYYGLASTDLLGAGSEFLQANNEWSRRTLRWILATHKRTGENAGLFIEEDCPTSIAPENVFWGLSCLSFLQKYGVVEERAVNGVVESACNWILNNFLQDKNLWSVTRLFFAVNILRIWNKLGSVGQKQREEISHFINSLRRLDGFQEFPASVKAGYREDVGQIHVCLHSTLYALLSLRILGIGDINVKEVKSFVDNFRLQNGFGIQLKIKEYRFGSPSTLLENLLVIVAYLASTLPKD